MQGVPARVVAVSSNGHRWGDVDLEDLHWKKRKYNPWAAYGALLDCQAHNVGCDKLCCGTACRCAASLMQGHPKRPTSCLPRSWHAGSLRLAAT